MKLTNESTIVKPKVNLEPVFFTVRDMIDYRDYGKDCIVLGTTPLSPTEWKISLNNE